MRGHLREKMIINTVALKGFQGGHEGWEKKNHVKGYVLKRYGHANAPSYKRHTD